MENNSLIQQGDEEMENLFNMFDINKDGFITEKEIKLMMKNLGEKVRKKDVRKMIKEADLNKDGKISFTGETNFIFSFSFAWLPEAKFRSVKKRQLTKLRRKKCF